MADQRPTLSGALHTAAFGARAHGLLCGYRFAAGVAAREIGLDEALAFLAEASADAGGDFLWLHFDLTDAGAEPWMRAHLSLAPEFHEALGTGTRTTRIEDVADHLVAVVNDVAYEFSFDPSEIATLWLTVTPQLVVSARRHPLRTLDRLRQAVREGQRFDGPVALLNRLLDQQGQVLVHIVRETTMRVDSIEDGLLRGRVDARRAELGRMRRVLVRLQRLLAPEPAALFRMLRQPPPWIGARALDELRQSSEEFSLVLRDLAALQERIKLLQEEIAAMVGEQTNRSLFTLTVVTVLALPINITTGFFGMNVGGIPLSGHAHGFAWVALGVAAVTALAAWWFWRRRD